MTRPWFAIVCFVGCAGGGEDKSDTAADTDTDSGTDTGGDALAECHPTTVDVALCDPSVATFSLASTNPWYPLIPGLVVNLEGQGKGDEAGIHLTVVRTVLEETETVMGVETHILRHETYRDGIIHEIASNFYVEATDGTVCYFGEDVEFYDEDGVFANTPSSS